MNRDSCPTIHSERGFSLIEMMIVIGVMAILAAIAIPSFTQWRQRLEYRETARSIAEVIRQAKSNSANGTEQQVEFNGGQYGYKACEYANNAPCATVLANVNTLPVSVAAIPPAGHSPIQFWANGTVVLPGNVLSITIPVNDTNNTNRFNVTVTNTGRVSITP